MNGVEKCINYTVIAVAYILMFAFFPLSLIFCLKVS